jgi:HEPN domain-containing protein
MARKKLFSRADGYSENDLLVASRDHMISARLLFNEGSLPGLDSAGYLAHLSFELLLKAALLYLEDKFPQGHDLGELLAQVRAAGLKLRVSTSAKSLFERLKSFYDLRYPNPGIPVSIAAPDGALIERTWTSLWNQLPEPLQAKMPAFYELRQDGMFRKGGRVIMIRKKDSGKAR